MVERLVELVQRVQKVDAFAGGWADTRLQNPVGAGPGWPLGAGGAEPLGLSPFLCLPLPALG